MEKHKWETAWEEKKFNIDTLTPSLLVSKYENNLHPGDHVLDIGCGNGRNSIYLAKLGCDIDCFDVTDLGWQKSLPDNLKDKVHFEKNDILEYPYAASKYQAVIATRVIQYLHPEELIFLIDKMKNSLISDGFLLLSYNTQGGIFNRKEIDVPVYSHPIQTVEQLLKTAFRNVVITEGGKVSMHVNYTDTIVSFDIYASDPHSAKP